MAQNSHRYLRFARALALLTGIAPAASGCAMQHGTSDDVPLGVDAPTVDSGPVADTGTDTGSDSGVDAPVLADAGVDTPDPCSTCTCAFGGDDPDSCETMGFGFCCYAIGPLSPPELA